MARHKLPTRPRAGRLIVLLTAVFGVMAALTLLVTHSAAPRDASTVALDQASLSTGSSRQVVGHWRQHHVSPSPARWSFQHVDGHWQRHVSPSPAPSSSAPATAPSSPSSNPSTTTPPATNSPTPSPSSPSPTPSPTSTGSSQVMPSGVPAAQVGKLLVNDSGDDLASWPRQARGTGGTMTHANGVLYLSTSGANANGYSIISPSTYTSGIFEARVYFPGSTDGTIADWPAFWLSSAWSGAVSWPDGGEMDLAEGLGGDLCVTYHYGNNGTPEQTTSKGVTSTPGWHTITGVWQAGEWDTYYDGTLVSTIKGVVVNDPMNVIFTAYQGNLGDQPGDPSTLEVSYLRIWSLAG